jgi:hypothetical protein
MAPPPAIPAAAAVVVGNEAGFAVHVATAVQLDHAADLLFAAHANSAVSHITTSVYSNHVLLLIVNVVSRKQQYCYDAYPMPHSRHDL